MRLHGGHNLVMGYSTTTRKQEKNSIKLHTYPYHIHTYIIPNSLHASPVRPAWVSITGDHNGHPLEVVGRLGFRPAPKSIRQALHERSP